MNEEELRKEVMQNKGTEAPFSGKLLHEKRSGMYKCAACGNELFKSDAKFDSGTGWPSFDDVLPGAVNFVHDESHGMQRTEVVCAKCGSHLGHLFDDLPSQSFGKASGPLRADGKPATRRYCMNSVCLDFEEK